MASNKVNKAKGKYDKSKGTSINPNNEEIEDYDFSLLRKPIQTSITGLGQAKKIFDLATEEIKKLLSDECDVLYECKVCRNIFRSLVNFISHKRAYCKEIFNSTQHGHFIQPTPTHIEMQKIQQTEACYQESLKGNTDIEEDNRIPLTKDLTTIIEKISQNRPSYVNTKDFQVALQEIPSTSVAVFQNLENGLEKDSDNMLNQVTELDKIMSKDMGVMQSDGNFKIESSADMDNNVIQISDDEDNTDTVELKCKICDMQFSTQKTLKFHMKYKHVESRLVYPCPDCLEIFSTSWSVYRHLFKVHRKSAAQIRRLRESIQAKAFKMNNPPAFYERRKNNQKPSAAPKITEEERIEQENQAWMDNMEFDGEISRCGGCGRTFERRAALAAHTHTCQPRSRALSRRPETKRIEIQIRKDYNKGPNANLNLLKLADTVETKNKDEPVEELEKETVEKKPLEKESLDKEAPEKEAPEKEAAEPTVMDVDAKDVEENSMDVVPQSEAESNASVSPDKNETQDQVELPQAPVVRLPFAQHAEKSNLMALRQRIIGDIELSKLNCKRCNTHCDHIRSLYDHVAEHYKWMRYACKLCNFKHYHFEQLPEHVKTVHKLKGDKDFYFSTVKAIDGAEALELSEDPVEEVNEESPESRQPSRCSSDSSRMSDDSSSSSVKIDSRKRKVQLSSRNAKRKKDSLIKVNKEDGVDENDSSSQKNCEENSSDFDYDVTEKVGKSSVIIMSSVASRRPVRRKAKPKNADFEYDLSNLLKMEAQGYRENQTSSNTNTKQTKKKPQTDSINFDILNKECSGAMDTLSRKAVENARAEMKTSGIAVFSCPIQRPRPIPSNVFVRPMLPKIAKVEKITPKEELNEEKIDISPSKENKNKTQTVELVLKEDDDEVIPKQEPIEVPNVNKDQKGKGTSLLINSNQNKESNATDANDATPTKEIKSPVATNRATTSKVQNPINKTIKSVVPIKFRKQGIDVIKNPLINQNIKEFTKAGMKTKILVIKPIKMKDGTQPVNSPLKFQTIKLKDPNRKSTGEDKSSDQVVVVKVPNVERNIVLSLSESTTEKQSAATEKQNAATEKQNAATEKQNAATEKQNAVTEKPAEIVEKPAVVADQNEISTPPVVPIDSVNEAIQENSDTSKVNLLCNEDIKTVDLNSSKENKPIVETVENQTTTPTNGIS